MKQFDSTIDLHRPHLRLCIDVSQNICINHSLKSDSQAHVIQTSGSFLLSLNLDNFMCIGQPLETHNCHPSWNLLVLTKPSSGLLATFHNCVIWSPIILKAYYHNPLKLVSDYPQSKPYEKPHASSTSNIGYLIF